MINEQKEKTNNITLQKLNEELDIDKIIPSERIIPERNSFDLKYFLGEEDNNNKTPEDIEKKILEMAEWNDFDMANSKKNKNKKVGLDILNEELEKIIKKTLNENKSDSKGTDSLSKKSKKTKKLGKKKYSDEEDNDLSSSNNNKDNSINLFNIRDYNYTNSDESSSEDDKELQDFLNKKTCRNKNLLKYRNIYEKKKNNKYKEIILSELIDSNDNDSLKEDNEDTTIKQNKNNNKKDDNDNNKKQKHLKRLIKNKDNKEMELPLDTECIICTYTIKELANPDGCNHNFCKSCLIEWLQRSSKCPLCKKTFNNIFIYDDGIKKQMSLYEIRNKYKKQKKSENNENSNKDNDEDSDEGCYMCGKNTDQGKLLICDRCTIKCCHLYCCGLDKIPKGKWFCDYCKEEMEGQKIKKKAIGHFIL